MLKSLQGYVDDSGSGEQDEYFVLAGYILPAEFWARLAVRWDIELKREPAVHSFKMADAEYGDGHFLGMREEFRKLKVNEMSSLLTPFKPMGVACCVKWQDWEEVVSGRVPKILDNPYTALFYGIIMLTHHWQEHLGGQYKVEFDFDEQGHHGLNALQWYEPFKAAAEEPYRSMMGGTPRFLDDEEVLPLQAADLLAWHVHRGLTQPSEPRPVFAKLTENYTPLPLGRGDLERYVQSFAVRAREHMEGR